MPTYTQVERALSVTSPLGTDVLLLLGFSGTESLSRLFSYQLDLASANDAIAAKDIVGKTVTWSISRIDQEPALLQRDRQPVRRRGPEPPQAADLPRRGRPLALAAHPHHRLPDLPEPEHPGHHQGHLRRLRLQRLRARAQGLLPQAGILRPVPRDRVQLHLPADGARGDLLLLPPRGRQAHDGAGRRDQLVRRLSREPGRILARFARAQPHPELGAPLRVPLGQVDPDRLQLRDPQHQPADDDRAR